MPLEEGLNSAEQLKKVLQANLYHGNRTWCFYTDLLSLLLLFLKSIITEIYSRVSIVVRLRSQNGLGQKWLLSKAMPDSSFLGTSYPICLQCFLSFFFFLIIYLNFIGHAA